MQRDDKGLEKRYPVILTAEEKLIARKVSLAFKVCNTALHTCTLYMYNKVCRANQASSGGLVGLISPMYTHVRVCLYTCSCSAVT